MAEDFDNPETNQHNGGRAGNCSANQADPVVSIEQNQPKALPQLIEIKHADL
jgi:hypothetical protein